jgi:hypothetical protein
VQRAQTAQGTLWFCNVCTASVTQSRARWYTTTHRIHGTGFEPWLHKDAAAATPRPPQAAAANAGCLALAPPPPPALACPSTTTTTTTTSCSPGQPPWPGRSPQQQRCYPRGQPPPGRRRGDSAPTNRAPQPPDLILSLSSHLHGPTAARTHDAGNEERSRPAGCRPAITVQANAAAQGAASVLQAAAPGEEGRGAANRADPVWRPHQQHRGASIHTEVSVGWGQMVCRRARHRSAQQAGGTRFQSARHPAGGRASRHWHARNLSCP